MPGTASSASNARCSPVATQTREVATTLARRGSSVIAESSPRIAPRSAVPRSVTAEPSERWIAAVPSITIMNVVPSSP